jgi:hypothetical protein
VFDVIRNAVMRFKEFRTPPQSTGSGTDKALSTRSFPRFVSNVAKRDVAHTVPMVSFFQNDRWEPALVIRCKVRQVGMVLVSAHSAYVVGRAAGIQ